MAKPKKEKVPATLDDVVATLNKLTDAIEKLVQPVIIGSTVGTVTQSSGPVQALPTAEEPRREDPKFPVPYEFNELKDTLLNKTFGIEIDYLPDQAAMNFSILVPKKYSNAGENHWITYKEDRRSKVISNALGANGVRQWCEQVYNNFNESTKSAITYDRSQL